MALKNRETGKQYIRLTKEGNFTIGKDGEPYQELEGTIVAMRYKDEEYEGTPIRKLYTTIRDEDNLYELGLNVTSPYYTTLVGFLKNVDINSKLTLHPKVETKTKDGKEITRRGILVSQGGKYAKGHFTQASGNTTPEWKTVRVGNVKVTDKSDYLEFYENFVTKNLIALIENNTPIVSTRKFESLADDEQVESVVEANDEKMPWD